MKATTVLIADNDPAFIDAARSILQRKGYVVKTASDGLEAISIIEESVNGPLPIDLLLTDLRMPNMNGMDIVRQLSEKGLSLATVVVSGYGDAQTLRELIHQGISEFVPKPCTVAELMKAVQSALAKQKNVSASMLEQDQQ